MDLLRLDDFSERVGELVAQGWIIGAYTRYDPTHIEGITPTGKAFTFDLAGNTATVTIAGNTRIVTIAKEQWLSGAGTVAALAAARERLPGNQR